MDFLISIMSKNTSIVELFCIEKLEKTNRKNCTQKAVNQKRKISIRRFCNHCFEGLYRFRLPFFTEDFIAFTKEYNVDDSGCQ